MPSSSLVRIAPGRERDAAELDRRHRPPPLPPSRSARDRAERLDPDRQVPEHRDVAHAGVEDEPDPAVRGRDAGDQIADQRRPQRAAAVDDEHPAVARPFDALPEEDVVVEAADRSRSAPLNSVSPPNCRSCSPQTSASGFSSERSAVEVTGRGYAQADTARERHGERERLWKASSRLRSRRGSPSGRLPEALRERATGMERGACGADRSCSGTNGPILAVPCRTCAPGDGRAWRYQRTVSSRCAGCAVVPAKTTLNVYVPAGSGS